uniref:Uncharacterized protein n=1 Tax=Meloidogyne hapla TaxID=6305 RepID=A0A1I8AYA2_MELHA
MGRINWTRAVFIFLRYRKCEDGRLKFDNDALTQSNAGRIDEHDVKFEETDKKLEEKDKKDEEHDAKIKEQEKKDKEQEAKIKEQEKRIREQEAKIKEQEKKDKEQAENHAKLNKQVDEEMKKRIKLETDFINLVQRFNDKDKNDEKGRAEIMKEMNEIKSNMTEMRFDINMLKNWKEQVESEKLEARVQAEQDKTGGGDDGCSTEGRKRKKRGITDKAKQLLEKGKNLRDANQPFLQDPERYLKKKGGLLKKGAEKVIGTLETACVVKTAGLGTPLCSLAADGLNWVADKGITELCKLAGKGIQLVKEGVGKAAEWVADGIKSFLPWEQKHPPAIRGAIAPLND